MKIKEYIDIANTDKTAFSKAVIKVESEKLCIDEAEIVKRTELILQNMKDSVKPVDTVPARCLMVGNASEQYASAHRFGSILSPIMADAAAIALQIAQNSAAMGRIVAAPTAGSCGVLPGVLLSLQKHYKIDDTMIIKGLINSSGVGMAIAEVAGISGAAGGCQAEIGSASAMAASATVELLGGTADMCAEAVALALKFIMGLVCDPVAGLVVCPCIKRNGSGAVNALYAAEMALCGIKSMIPVDEVIEAMKQVGESMCSSLKETAQGGLAITPTGKQLSAKLTEMSKVNIL